MSEYTEAPPWRGAFATMSVSAPPLPLTVAPVKVMLLPLNIFLLMSLTHIFTCTLHPKRCETSQKCLKMQIFWPTSCTSIPLKLFQHNFGENSLGKMIVPKPQETPIIVCTSSRPTDPSIVWLITVFFLIFTSFWYLY